MSLTRGARLGPYEIIELIGEGGMGAVYRARDPRLDRDVAIKVLRADLVADPDRRARLLQEAKALSAVTHPNIVTVHDVGTENDAVFVVMELVQGEPLDDVIRRGGLRVPDILRIGAQIADACARAHALHIIHRDLKPANIMLQADGRVKVLDFGLAKLVGGVSDASAGDVTRTAEGLVQGTVAYMSPEQAEGKPLDPRSDIFSLGAVLYELCSGTRAFPGDSAASVMANVLRQDPPPVSAARPDLPPELARLVMRCLRKDPARRVQSMADLKVALEELKEDVDSGRLSGPVAAPAASRSSTPRWLLGAAAVLGLGVVAVVLWRVLLPKAGPAADDAPRLTQFTSYPGTEQAGGFSPDGSQVVFAWNGERGDNFDLYVKLVNTEPPLRLTTDPRPDLNPRWSPDGRQIAFIRRLEEDQFAVLLVPPLGGPEHKVGQFFTRLINGTPLCSIGWTPDSKSLFLTGSTVRGEPNHLLRVSLETGEVRKVLAAAGHAQGYSMIELSPDHRTLGAVRNDASDRRLDLIALSDTLEPRGTTTPSGVPPSVWRYAWTADSRSIIYSIGSNNPAALFRIVVAGGSPEPILWAGAGAGFPVISRDGSRMVFTRQARDANFWRIPLDRKGPPQQVASSTFREAAPQYSPDGKRLAFASNRTGSVQIWTADADGSRPVQLTSLDPLETTSTPRWSPDGQRIAFDSSAGGAYQIYVIGADGGMPRQITSGSTNFVATWSGDGQWVYFTSDRSGRHEVWRARPDGRAAEQVTHDSGEGPFISADGQWLYFTKLDGRGGIWRQPAAGGAETRVADDVYRNNFAPTASGIYFEPFPKAGGTSTVQFKDFKTGALTEIIKPEKPVDLGLAVSPDGRELIFATLDYAGADLMLVEHFR